MRFLILTENTENKILLFSVFGSFGKTFFSENENRKQPNQTPPNPFKFYISLSLAPPVANRSQIQQPPPPCSKGMEESSV